MNPGANPRAAPLPVPVRRGPPPKPRVPSRWQALWIAALGGVALAAQCVGILGFANQAPFTSCEVATFGVALAPALLPLPFAALLLRRGGHVQSARADGVCRGVLLGGALGMFASALLPLGFGYALLLPLLPLGVMAGRAALLHAQPVHGRRSPGAVALGAALALLPPAAAALASDAVARAAIEVATSDEAAGGERARALLARWRWLAPEWPYYWRFERAFREDEAARGEAAYRSGWLGRDHCGASDPRLDRIASALRNGYGENAAHRVWYKQHHE